MERRERGRVEEVEEVLEGMRGVEEVVLEVETVRVPRRGAVLLVGSLRGEGLRVPVTEERPERVLVVGARTGRVEVVVVLGRETALAGREVLATRLREGAREGGLDGVGDCNGTGGQLSRDNKHGRGERTTSRAWSSSTSSRI